MSLELFSFSPKTRAKQNIDQKLTQLFQNACKSLETCIRFKAYTENHQSDDLIAALGRWEDSKS